MNAPAGRDAILFGGQFLPANGRGGERVQEVAGELMGFVPRKCRRQPSAPSSVGAGLALEPWGTYNVGASRGGLRGFRERDGPGLGRYVSQCCGVSGKPPNFRGLTALPWGAGR